MIDREELKQKLREKVGLEPSLEEFMRYEELQRKVAERKAWEEAIEQD